MHPSYHCMHICTTYVQSSVTHGHSRVFFSAVLQPCGLSPPAQTDRQACDTHPSHRSFPECAHTLEGSLWKPADQDCISLLLAQIIKWNLSVTTDYIFVNFAPLIRQNRDKIVDLSKLIKMVQREGKLTRLIRNWSRHCCNKFTVTNMSLVRTPKRVMRISDAHMSQASLANDKNPYMAKK